MKTFLIIGFLGTFFIYIFASMVNHTFDILMYKDNTIFAIVMSTFLCWVVAIFCYNENDDTQRNYKVLNKQLQKEIKELIDGLK